MQQEIIGVYGKPVSRVVRKSPVRDDNTGEIYPCVGTFAKAKGVSPYTVYSLLINNGSTKNVGIGRGKWERTPEPFTIGPYTFSGGKRQLVKVLGHQKTYYYNLVSKYPVEKAHSIILAKLDKMSKDRKLPADIDPEERLRVLMEGDAKRIKARQTLIALANKEAPPRKDRSKGEAAATARLRYVLDGGVISVPDLAKKAGMGPYKTRVTLMEARANGQDFAMVGEHKITWVKI